MKVFTLGSLITLALVLVPDSRRGVFWTSDLSSVFPIAVPCVQLDNVCEGSHAVADM